MMYSKPKKIGFPFFPGLKADKLSHDSKVVQAYETDPLVNAGKITLRLGWELMNKFEKYDSITSILKLPLLVQCGAEDSLILLE